MSYLEPLLPALLLLLLISLIRAWRNSEGTRPWLLTLGVVGLLLLSLNPIAWLLARPLEIWYEDKAQPDSKAEAIVVLAGAVNPAQPDRPYALAAHDTYERVQHAAWLFKNWNSVPVLICGGGEDRQAYSEAMRHLLEIEGVPANLIWVESQSRSTHENAVYGGEILREHGVSRVALVIDARSMLRAAASFRKQGISVVPAPIRFWDLDLSLQDILPTWRAIEANGETLHEMAGILWYRVRGWI